MGADVLVTKQITFGNLPFLIHSGIRTVIDIRPDNEEAGQPESRQMQARVEGSGLHFAYIPVAHGAIPDEPAAPVGASSASGETSTRAPSLVTVTSMAMPSARVNSAL